MQFDVEVTESGEAGRVKLRDASPGERALEACLGHALEGMTLPVSVLRRIPKEKAVSPGSRGVAGEQGGSPLARVHACACAHTPLAKRRLLVALVGTATRHGAVRCGMHRSP
jgi:hypothetical protein